MYEGELMIASSSPSFKYYLEGPRILKIFNNIFIVGSKTGPKWDKAKMSANHGYYRDNYIPVTRE